MEKYNFSEPTRQSARGIIISVLIAFGSQIKKGIFLFGIVIFQWLKRPELVKSYALELGGVFGIVVGFLIIKEILDYRNFTFQLKEDEFYLTHGILKKTTIVIPISKIQNSNSSQNLLQQILQVVQVNIDSSGDEGDEIQIKALSKSKAQALQKALLSTSKNLVSEEATTDKILVKLSLLDLFLVGIAQNHFRNLIIVSVAIISFYSDIEAFLVEYGATLDSKFVKVVFNENIILGSVFIVLFLILLGLFYSIVTIFIVNFNFTVKKNSTSFVVEKGLINKIAFAIHLDKIQSVEYTTNFLKSKFGLFTLRLFQTATENKTFKKRDLVGLKIPNLRTLEKHIFGLHPLDGITKSKPHQYYLKKIIVKAFLIVLLINVYIYFSPSSLFFALNVVLLPVVAYLSYLKWNKSYYYFDENYMVLGSGVIDTNTSIAELTNVQSVKLTQTYFQKQRNLFDVHFHTASNRFTVPCVESETAMVLYDYVLYKIESSAIVWQ